MADVSDALVCLKDGNCVPLIGLGCYKVPPEVTYQTVSWAIDSGYRHIDTAALYNNEHEVGKAVRDSDEKREKITVASKLWPSSFAEAEKGIELSLKKLNIDYIDVYMLHWPGLDEGLRFKAWEAMLRYKEKGYIKSIGVSNFYRKHLESIQKEFGDFPMLNQVELHPWSQKRELSCFCKQNEIALNAWGPIFRGHISEVPLLEELSVKYEKTPVQVTIRWHLQHNNILVPKSSNKERIHQNAQVFDFKLDEADMKKIDDLECGRQFARDPDTYPDE